MSDVEPLATPDRPDPNELIASAWGQWAQDELTARGVKAFAQVVASQVLPANTFTDLTGLTVTFTALASRWYRVRGSCLFTPTTPGQAVLGLYEGAGMIGQAQAYTGIGGNGITTVLERVIQLTAGAHTYKLAANLVPGGSLYALASAPSFLYVEDVGP